MSNKNEVAVPLQEHNEYSEIIALPKALMGGTREMKKAGRDFLPQDPKEKNDAYLVRLKKTYLLPGYKRTINLLTGQVFSKPINMPEETPEEIASLRDDIDKAGNNLDVFCRKVFKDGIDRGSSCILVDMPKGDGGGTKAEEEDAGIRPYFVHVKSENIIGWKTDENENLLQLRIEETAEIPDGEYGVKTENRIRVLEPGSFKVYREVDKGQWEIATDADGNQMTGKTSLDFIPLVIFMPGEPRSKITANPPLEDLAYINLAHWQSQSDQRNILHVARVPILFGKMLGKIDKVAVGASRMLNSDNEKGDLKYVEHTGAAIAAGRLDLEDLKSEMGLFGLQLMVPKTGDVTATQAALESSESDSTLKSWALMFQDTLNTALSYMGEYIGVEYDEVATVNTEYRNLLQEFTPKELLEAAREGILAKQVVFVEFKRRGLVVEDMEWEENLSLLEDEGRSTGDFSTFANSALG